MADSNFRTRDYWKCFAACFLLSLSPFQYGVDFGLIGGFQAMVGFLKIFGYKDPATPIGYNIKTNVQQLISSLMTVGAFVGSLLAGSMAVYLGRKNCIRVACVLCCASNGIMQGTTSVGGLYAGRLLIGIANGFFMTFGQLYIQEVIPAQFRGAAIATFNVFTSLGSLVGTIVDNFTSKIAGRDCYLIPLALIYIVPAILFLGSFLIPESPRYLVGRGKPEQARIALIWLRPTGMNIDAELLEIEASHASEMETGNSASWLDMFRDPIDRRRTFLAVAGVSTQAASGAFFMIAYGTYFFEMAGVGHPFENSCILSGVSVFAIIICVFIMPRYGRRRVFLTTSLIICGFCQLIVAACYTTRKLTEIKKTGDIIVAFSIIYLVAYNGGMSSFAWVVGGEIPRQQLRSHTFGLAAGMGFIGAWLAAFTAPYFINPSSLNWGPQYGYIWFPSCLIAAAFVFFFIPETKNRTLEEINEMFEARLPARKFRGYTCTIHNAAREKAALHMPADIAITNTIEGGAIGKAPAEASVEMVEHVLHHKA